MHVMETAKCVQPWAPWCRAASQHGDATMPPGWEIYMGPTGNPYYYDHFHHKSIGVDLTPEWEIKKDESTGKFYYSKKSMEEKVWIVPTLLQGWEKKISATKGKPCYYNNALKKTTWNLPEIYENQT